MSPASVAAGGHPQMTLNFSRPDGHKLLDSVALSLPVGLVGAPGSSPDCPATDAASGDHAADSEVDSVVTNVGSGTSLVAHGGKIYNPQTDPGEPSPFIYARSGCGALTLTTQIKADDGTIATHTASFNTTGCDALAFNATIALPVTPPQSTFASAQANLSPGFKLIPSPRRGWWRATTRSRFR